MNKKQANGVFAVLVVVRVSTNSQKQGVQEFAGGLKVRVNAKPFGGRANSEVIELLADYFKVAASRIRILRGHSNNKKTIEIA